MKADHNQNGWEYLEAKVEKWGRILHPYGRIEFSSIQRMQGLDS
jgi:hypothetical protein